MKPVVSLVLIGALALAACGGSLEGNGDVVTENRAVADFNEIDADNGVRVFLTVDPTAAGDVVLAVTTDSNLQEFLTTEVTGTTLTVSSDRSGGVTPTEAFEVSGTVDAITVISVDDGAQLEVAGTVDSVTLSADNGAQLDGENLEATTVTVKVDGGARISVCATDIVTGEVRNGAKLTVLCGARFDDVETSGGGTVTSAP